MWAQFDCRVIRGKIIPVRAYGQADLAEMAKIWNAVVEAGNAFSQEEALTVGGAAAFFGAQTYTGVAVELWTRRPLALYRPTAKRLEQQLKNRR